MQRRWHASKYQKKANNCRHEVKLSDSDQVKGSRIINLDQLRGFMNQLTTHAAQCHSQIILRGEEGWLASVLSSQC